MACTRPRAARSLHAALGRSDLDPAMMAGNPVLTLNPLLETKSEQTALKRTHESATTAHAQA